MGIGSELRKIGRKLDLVSESKEMGQALLDKATGRDKEKAAELQRAHDNEQAIIAAENASQPLKHEYDFEGTIKAAQEAGLNPLTALRTVGANSSQTQFHAPILNTMPTKKSYGERAFTGFQTYMGFNNFQETQKNTRINTGLEQNYIRSQTALNMKNLNTTQRGKEDIPILVTAYDPTGKLADFLIPNPEMFEMSLSEFTSSLGVVATSFASQNNITKNEAKDILISMYKNRNNNIELKNSKLSDEKRETYSEWKAKQVTQKTSIISTTDIPTSTIQGLTNNARERQDRINKAMGWK